MESPFFRNHWNYHPQPQRPRYVHPDPTTTMGFPVQRRTEPMAPKVVSIPVRFLEPKKTRSDSATKIQTVFRGFLVRKILDKVLAIEREVNEIERRLANEETVESIRRDSKERVRFGEMLMSLLLRLDSVKGVDSGIRNFRKAVIKKAIALQEKVDAISEAVDRSSEVNVSGAVEEIPEHEDQIVAAELENVAIMEESNVNLEVPVADDELKALEEQCHQIRRMDSSNKPPDSGNGDDPIEEEEDGRMKGREEGEQSRDLLEKMMVENKKMVEMMGQLFEKNEMQSQLLCSLSQRVEQLEKALVYEMLRKKKKKRNSSVDCSQKCPKTKKTGKS